MTVRGYCRCVREHLEGIEAVCKHAGEEAMYRRIGLIEGLKKLGVER